MSRRSPSRRSSNRAHRPCEARPRAAIGWHPPIARGMMCHPPTPPGRWWRARSAARVGADRQTFRGGTDDQQTLRRPARRAGARPQRVRHRRDRHAHRGRTHEHAGERRDGHAGRVGLDRADPQERRHARRRPRWRHGLRRPGNRQRQQLVVRRGPGRGRPRRPQARHGQRRRSRCWPATCPPSAPTARRTPSSCAPVSSSTTAPTSTPTPWSSTTSAGRPSPRVSCRTTPTTTAPSSAASAPTPTSSRSRPATPRPSSSS